MGVERIILHVPIRRGEEERGGSGSASTQSSAMPPGGTNATTKPHSWDNDMDMDVEPATASVRQQGRPDGLFRACMDSIRQSHTIGQALRGSLIVVGLMTDRHCYAELLGQFYVVTYALETRMEELLFGCGNYDREASTLIVAKMKVALGYSFVAGYESDLLHLLGPQWRETIASWTTDPASRYVERLCTASDEECAAAAFILHGPLIIGGGAALRPRVARAFGEGATGVFESVCGRDTKGRSRAGRRKEFIEFYDSLLDHNDDQTNDKSKDVRFNTIVRSCSEFMDLNNEMMMTVKRSPWWRKYAAACTVAAVSISAALVWRLLLGESSSPTVKT